MVFRVLCLLLLTSISISASAEIAGLPFESEAEEQRFRDLAAELRCLVCQNQSLSDSNAPLAQDLRSELYEQVKKGNSEVQIISFMTDRYGEFILYKPRFTTKTLLLWLTPVLLSLIGIFCIFRFTLKRKQGSEPEVSESELIKVRELLETEIQNK